MPTLRKLMTPALACVLISCAFLAACETIPWGRGETTDDQLEAVVGRSVPCSELEQIIPSRRDTDITIGKLREQNAVIAAICGST